MQKSGYLDRREWGAGAQLAIVDHDAFTSTVAVETPNGKRFPAEVAKLHPLTLRVGGKVWSMKQISEKDATMTISSPLPITYFSVAGEVAQEPEAGPGQPSS